MSKNTSEILNERLTFMFLSIDLYITCLFMFFNPLNRWKMLRWELIKYRFKYAFNILKILKFKKEKQYKIKWLKTTLDALCMTYPQYLQFNLHEKLKKYIIHYSIYTRIKDVSLDIERFIYQKTISHQNSCQVEVLCIWALQLHYGVEIKLFISM